MTDCSGKMESYCDQHLYHKQYGFNLREGISDIAKELCILLVILFGLEWYVDEHPDFRQQNRDNQFCTLQPDLGVW